MTSVAPTPDEIHSDSTQSTLALCRDLIEEASREKRKLIPRWAEFYKLIRNRSWSPYRASWLPSPTSSEVFPALHSLASYLTSQRPRTYPSPYLGDDVDFQPSPELLADKADLMGTVLASWWQTAKVQRSGRLAVWDALGYGAGILKTGWNSTLFHGSGDATATRVDCWNLLPDPCASSFEDAGYVIELSEPQLYDVMMRFPRTASQIETTDSPGWPIDKKPDIAVGFDVLPQGQLAPINRIGVFPGTATTGQAARYGSPGAGYRSNDFTRKVRLAEVWIRETEHIRLPVIVGPGQMEEVEVSVPRWRFVAIANQKVLADMPNPFPHGQLPYVRVPYLENGEFWSLPLIEQIDRAQLAENRILASLQMNLELSGNPILVDTAQSGLSRTKVTNRPGGRLTESTPNSIRWLQPPNVSSEMLAAVQNYRDSIDRTVGISAVNRGEALRRREPAQAVDVAQEAAGQRIGDTLNNIEGAYREVTTQVADLISAYYLEPRTLPVGNRQSPPFIDLPPKAFFYPYAAPGAKTVKDVPVRWSVDIEAGSSLPLSHQAKVGELVHLLELGVVDAQYVLEQIDIPGAQEILQRLQSAAAAQPQPQA